MDRESILNEIRRTAEEGRALGRERFEQETGIKESDWLGKHQARQSDAVAEAALSPSQWNAPYSTEYIISELISMIRELGKQPTHAERKLYQKRNPDTPSHNTYYRLGNQARQALAVLDYARQHDVPEAVLAVCTALARPADEQSAARPETQGHVYLLKSGRFYKIGRSNYPARRAYEVRLQLPEVVTEVHRIETDDPARIEAYWHRRFADWRAEGEWFKLRADDVRDFKSRRIM